MIYLSQCKHTATLKKLVKSNHQSSHKSWHCSKSNHTFKIIDRSSLAPAPKAATACTFHWLSPNSRLPWLVEALEFSHDLGRAPDSSLHIQKISFGLSKYFTRKKILLSMPGKWNIRKHENITPDQNEQYHLINMSKWRRISNRRGTQKNHTFLAPIGNSHQGIASALINTNMS